MGRRSVTGMAVTPVAGMKFQYAGIITKHDISLHNIVIINVINK